MAMRVAVAVWMMALALGAQGQMAGGDVSAPGTMVAPARAVDSEIGIIEGEMMRLVKAMPEEKFSFAPSAAVFAPGQTAKFEGVRSFAQQATHVAQANYSLFAMASGLKPDVDVKAIGAMTKKDDIVAALAGSFAFAHKAAGMLTVANAFEVVKSPEPGVQTRSTLAMFTVAHANDHYGQMVEYLRMNGMAPPSGM